MEAGWHCWIDEEIGLGGEECMYVGVVSVLGGRTDWRSFFGSKLRWLEEE
ncbi:unnamed protein product, partial [Linum tenue]